MDIRFNCPRCGQHLSVEERGAGTLVNCPGCKEQIEIPRDLPSASGPATSRPHVIEEDPLPPPLTLTAEEKKAATPMGVKVIEFTSENDYRAWLQRMGNRIRVVDVSTTKRWSPWTGFLGDSKTYTVTYEEGEIGTSAARAAAQHCSNCGSPLRAPAKFCSQCGKQIG